MIKKIIFVKRGSPPVIIQTNAAGAREWINEKKCVLESLIGIKRSRANFVITYYASYAAQLINKNS